MSATNIAKLLHLNEWQVNNVITLLQKDATIPFIARYRKEKTGDLDEVNCEVLRKNTTDCRNWKNGENSFYRKLKN